MSRLKVQGFNNLIRDTRSNAIINTSTSEYKIYMQRRKARENQADKLRDVRKEINTLKTELREIKNLILKGKK